MSAQNKVKKFNKKIKAKKAVKCYDCGGPHLRNKCTTKNKEGSEKSECVLYSALVDIEKDSIENKCMVNISRDVDKSLDKNDGPESVLYSALAMKTQYDDVWYADSGASKHMTHINFELENIKRPNISEVKLANNNKLKINHVGDLKCMIGDHSHITLRDVHYIPKLCVNLVSVSQLVKNNCTVIIALFATLGSLLNMKVKPDMNCIVCSMGKQARNSFADKGTRANGKGKIRGKGTRGPTRKC